ncbi:MAG: 2-phospho-L-lactate guanylyltransferase [Anaerolineales bacterium]
MTLWAIVPVKPFQQAKSRLAGVLSDAERVELSRTMLSQTLERICEVRQITRVVVVSADRQVLDLATAAGAVPLLEPDPPNLNRALRLAAETARASGATALLVVPADLPGLSAADLRTIIELAGRPPCLVIAADRHSRGTNALLLIPPALIEFDFGAESFARHVALGRAAGARVEICNLPALALDLDSPEDLALVRRAGPLLVQKES